MPPATGPRCVGGNLAEAHIGYRAHWRKGGTGLASQIKWLSSLFVAPAQTIEKVLHRHVERQRKLIKRAGGYAIGGPFVFLQLLKRNPDRLR